MTAAPSSVTSRIVTSKVDGIRIYGEALGDPSKPAVVYIHGNSTSSGVWDHQFFDEELLKHFYQVRFDLRGHGQSETPDVESEGPFDNDKQGSDVAAVLEGFSITNPIFVGWSYGALIPGDYVSIHGFVNVRGVVVVDGLTGPPPDVHKFFTGGPYPGFTDNSDATKMHKAYGLFIRALTYQPLPPTRQWIFKRKKDWGPYMEGASKAVPKLVIFGRQDGMNSLDYIDYIKTKWEPTLLTVKVINDAGHASFLEQPNQFNEALLEWAKKITQA
ncbi:alpha/beta-hydrolase [Neolentinus lepideus HHB14362 ss-1]|uniref:Alpha/beta-hydrolase n=1 Tax=Neolentinus lepideus HHB14362 ss-1 TaxID=1314782 RepID=A0A165RQE7_9AGAM|nr:alpha/beta-hydrolase [Neolentinus lepideus HHB14362 ss-1]